MKKMLSVFLWIFAVLSMFLLWNVIFAQEEVDVDGITVSWSCLNWMWIWCFDYEKIIGITGQNENVTATSIAQDVILSATYMVWTVLTIVIIYCGLWYIFASRDGKDVNKYKKWLITAAIGALLVWWAYAIVRLIQFIAKW